MGQRANYFIIDKNEEAVCLYSHWGAFKEDYLPLIEKVKGMKDLSIYKILNELKGYQTPDEKSVSNQMPNVLSGLVKTFTQSVSEGQVIVASGCDDGLLDINGDTYTEIENGDSKREFLKDIDKLWKEYFMIESFILIDIPNNISKIITTHIEEVEDIKYDTAKIVKSPSKDFYDYAEITINI